MRLVTSRHRLVLLVFVCLVSTCSADDPQQNETLTMTSHTTWQPSIWLRESMDICDDSELVDEEIKENLELTQLELKKLSMKFETFMKIWKKIHPEMSELGDNLYYFSKVKKNWYDGQQVCRSLGLELAAIENAQENELVTEHKWKTYGNTDAWIGGTDEDHEGHWVWSGSQQDLVFTDWNPGEPNNGINGNCIAIGWGRVAPKKWMDAKCSGKLNFICEASFVHDM